MNASYGAILAGVRRAKHVSLEAFAALIRVDAAQWAAFETGAPSVSTAAVSRAALALGLDPDRIDELPGSDRARTYRFVLDVLDDRGESLAGILSNVPPHSCPEDFAADALRSALLEAVTKHRISQGRALELLGLSVHEAATLQSVIPT